MLNHINAAGEPACLESSRERNVPLDTHFGFEVVGEVPSESGSAPIWRMWREPRVPEV
ncbi:MAG TPA: hypothetical protein VN796_10690 [Acidimicrobiales bacterium]|nr:hypothetical protein [Acidimicrobiales bacterium]